MPSNSVGGVSVSVHLDDADALRELNSLRGKLNKLNETLQAKRGQRDAVAAEMERAEVAAERARHKVMELQAALANAAPSDRAGIRQQLTAANADLREQTRNMDSLNRQWQKLNTDITDGEANMERMTSQTANLEQQVAASTSTMAKLDRAASKAAKRIEGAVGRIGRMIRRVFVFSVITRALRGLREYLGNLLMSTPEFSAALGRLKSALLTLAQPIIEVVIPALIRFMHIITQVVTALAALVSQLFGKTFSQSQAAAEALYEQAEAYKETGGAAKKAAGQLAAFDELNVLQDNASGGGASSGAATPQFDLRMDLTETELDDILKIVEAVGAALLGWKIGTGLGLGLTNILGLIGTIYSTFQFLQAYLDAWDNGIDWDNLKQLLLWLAAGATSAYIALGPLGAAVTLVVGGISLMVLGIRDLVKNGPSVVNVLTIISGAVATAAGAFILFKRVPGLISATTPGIKTALGNMAKTAALGGLAVFDGIMLAYDANAIAEAGKVQGQAFAAHNKEIDNALSRYAKLYEEKGKEAADQWALMVYNIDTTNMSFEEAQAAITETIEGYWDGVPKNMWEGFKAGWNDYFGENGKGLWQLFKDAFDNVIKWLKDLLGIHSPSTVFEGLGDDVGEGFFQGFKGAWGRITAWLSGGIEQFVNAIIDGLNWLISQMNKISFNIPDWVPLVGGQSWGVSIASIPKWTAPALAQGAVIPPNREFMAVLGDQKSGTNIETPLATMVEAFKRALTEGGYGDTQFIITMDGTKVTDQVVKRINRAARASGRLELV